MHYVERGLLPGGSSDLKGMDMNTTRQIISIGGGVNSTAMLILLREQGNNAEAVFCNHHGDHPDTYQYIQYLQENGYEITVLDTGDIWQHYYDKQIIPTRKFRHCTDHFKIRPMYQYAGSPCIMYIGIDYGEVHRAKQSMRRGITNEFPLIDAGLDRDGCISLIHKRGLKVPRKSGCYFCPYSSIGDIHLLRDQNPELYCRVKQLENNCKRSNLYLFGEKPVDVVVHNEQVDDLFGYRKPCQCGL